MKQQKPREIFVRAWDEKRNKMFYPGQERRPDGVRKNDFFVGFNSSGLEVSEYEGKGYWRVFPMMLYTGLTDHNGLKIFDKDIVKCNIPMVGDFHNVIEWFQSHVMNGWRIRGGRFTNEFKPSMVHNLQIEVIGNMYETPEKYGGGYLLESTTAV